MVDMNGGTGRDRSFPPRPAVFPASLLLLRPWGYSPHTQVHASPILSSGASHRLKEIEIMDSKSSLCLNKAA